MKSEPDREEALFALALKQPANERAAFLDAVCVGEPALRQSLEARLVAHERSDSLPATQDATARPSIKFDLADRPDEAVGQTLGRYKLLEKVGEGGCGVVYVAEQTEPVRRRVALKVIKLGMDTKAVVARFEAERQALAMMDHPNIAKVLDAGTTETGRPYFVMELVRGIRITEYCDQNNLSTKDRLSLFTKVCQAIQHAHQKGIIHRDIKPSNILVTLHDGVPVPKVIDFGIAKATEGRLTDATVYTQLHQFIGTPAYMSPEEAEMSGLDVDTRADIYSLGVLLYELLTGTTPFDAKELMDSGIDAMRKTIREKEPVRPSTRLATQQGEERTTTAKRRSSDPPKLIHSLRGDLDWIVMKTLEKDRTRRYETANALAIDIQRHLENEPVLASPPSRIYRFRKMARRNKSLFAAAGATATALLIGFAVSVLLYVQERAALERAVAAEKEQARLRQQAEEGARIGAALTEAGLCVSREQYDEAEKIASAIHHPAATAILNVLGMIHARRGEWPAAIADFTRTIDLLPTDHEAYHSLAPLLLQAGDIEAYLRLRASILKQFGGTTNPVIAERMAKDSLILPPSAPELEIIAKMADTAIAAGSGHNAWDYFQFVKGFGEYRRGHFDAAVDWLQKITSRDRDPTRTVDAYMVLAMARHQLGQLDEARSLLETGRQIAAARVASINGALWNDQMTARLLIREAEGLVEARGRK